MESPSCQDTMNTFIQTGIMPEQHNVDSATNFLCNIVTDTAKLAGMEHKPGGKPTPRRSKSHKHKNPKWYNKSCHDAYICIKRTATLLSKNPTNSWLRGRLSVESKNYKRMIRIEQKKHLNGLFGELDQMHSNDPKGYMELVKALREGNHDKVR